jgi:hypothetical protein
MRNAAMVAAAAATCTFGAVAVVADADGAARLVGHFRARVTITQVAHFEGTRDGESGIERFTFHPTCAKGSCATTLMRRNLAGLKSIQRLEPAGMRYTSSSSETAACTSPDGRVHAAHGAAVKQTLTIVPTHVRNGIAHGFTGTGQVIATPTAQGRADHCGRASETYSIKSVS